MALWSDINANVGIDGKPLVITDIADIETSMENILRCPLGSRGWWPTFGSELPFILWENVNSRNAQRIRVASIQAIRTWEKRVTVLSGSTYVTPNSANTGYLVQIGYVINATGTATSATFNFVKPK